jgi:hypothetical protein
LHWNEDTEFPDSEVCWFCASYTKNGGNRGEGKSEGNFAQKKGDIRFMQKRFFGCWVLQQQQRSTTVGGRLFFLGQNSCQEFLARMGLFLARISWQEFLAVARNYWQ